MESELHTGRSGKKWIIGKEDRRTFLKLVKFSKKDIDRMQVAEYASSAFRCLTVLQGISQSMQSDNVLICEQICLDQKIWALHKYKNDPSSFPITNVPIKCNILGTLVDSLREYIGQGVSERSLSVLVRTIQYLDKLIKAVVFNRESPVSFKIDHMPPESIRSRGLTGETSSTRASKRPKPATVVSAGIPKEKNLGIDNLGKFHEYKPLIVSLQHRLTFLDQSDHRNDFIFEFVSQNVCKFLLDDCKLLLADYIERIVLQI